MSTIIDLIKVLRERTGAGMMDCKKALEECELDVDRACDWLREKGIAKAAKKASRIAAEGLTYVCADENTKKAIIIEINCETDFVAKSDNYKSLVKDTAETILKKDLKTVEDAKADADVAELFTNATVKLGEKLDLRRFAIVDYTGLGYGAYMHMGGKISVLVITDKETEHAKGVAMHIAANNPQYISKDDVDAAAVEHETQIQMEAAKEDEKLASKPENVIAKIVAGKVSKMFAESTLSEQPYLLDGDKTVGNFLKDNGLKVVSFIRYAVGEGIEKRHDNFADEVMSQVK